MCARVRVSVCARDGSADLGFYRPAEPATLCRGALAAGTRGDAKGQRRGVRGAPPGSSGPGRCVCARGPGRRVAQLACLPWGAAPRGLPWGASPRGAGGSEGGGPSPRSPSLFCFPPQTMDTHGGRRLGARPPAEEPSPPAC